MIGERIKRVRNSLGWTQAKLADEAGVSQSTINTLEKRTKRPDAYTLNQVAHALGVTNEYLLEKEEVTK